MARTRRPSLPSWWPGFAAAALVVALVIAFGLAYAGGESKRVAGPFGSSEITDREFGELGIGASRDRIETALGPGQGALEYGQTGPAVEPIDAECTYYAPESGLLTAVVQLCYRDDRLVSKRRYALLSAQALAGPAG